jgi:hypothetical protein
MLRVIAIVAICGGAIPSVGAQERTRTINVAGGTVTVERERADSEERERVTVRSASGTLESDSWCPAEFGTYDELSDFFTRLQRAIEQRGIATVSALARYPLRVNAKDGKTLRIGSPAELRRRYDDVFTERVVSQIGAAVPAKLFCRSGFATIGNGVIWASRAKGRVLFDSINQ